MTKSVQTNLRTRLGRTAQQHAHAALDAYQREVLETFYVEAGIALELAIKAKLAGESPYLLAPEGSGWFKHGHRFARGDTTRPGPKSVSARDALERLKVLDPDLVTGIATQITETIDRRDQSVHMGAYSEPTQEELLTHVAAFVEAVNGLTLQEPAEFWDELADLASELVAKERDVVRLRVLRKFGDAKGRLATLSEEERDMLEDTATTYLQDHQEEQPELVVIDCPVCARDALGIGELTDDGEPIWEHREREPIGWAYDINTILTGFDCKVCRLALAGAARSPRPGCRRRCRTSTPTRTCSTNPTPILGEPRRRPNRRVRSRWLLGRGVLSLRRRIMGARRCRSGRPRRRARASFGRGVRYATGAWDPASTASSGGL